MKVRNTVFSLLLMLSVAPAFAGWEYDGYYVDDGIYTEDGLRFVINVRGGFSFGDARMKNDIGSLYGYYYVNNDNGDVISWIGYENAGSPTGYTFAGYGDLSKLPIRKRFDKSVFTAGFSLGFTVPNHTQWRVEAGYDHIAETNYNQMPLIEGNLPVTGGSIENAVVHVGSMGIKSTIATDVISIMGFYDFFNGTYKPMNKIVPYVGFGMGYAISKTTLHLSDIYGDLSTDTDLQKYGTVDSEGILQFDNPTDASLYPDSTDIALLGAVGLSYGITSYAFLDFQARLIYIPKIMWNISNSTGTMHREWFSAENMVYTNLLVGVRFEF